jgi:hypothetical protein
MTTPPHPACLRRAPRPLATSARRMGGADGARVGDAAGPQPEEGAWIG